MKLISNFCAVMTVILVVASWDYVKPVLSKNGTSVIYAMSGDGKNGGKPFTVKLPDNLTDKQFNLLNFAYDVAKEDNYKNPQYLQGIIMQESRAGSVRDYRVAGLTNKPGDRYFGVGQVKLAAAKSVMLHYPQMWDYLDTRTDEELQARLILDDEFNIRVASKYALIVGINNDSAKGITSYNLGEGGAKSVNHNEHEYTVKVKQYAQRFASGLKNIL